MNENTTAAMRIMRKTFFLIVTRFTQSYKNVIDYKYSRPLLVTTPAKADGGIWQNETLIGFVSLLYTLPAQNHGLVRSCKVCDRTPAMRNS